MHLRITASFTTLLLALLVVGCDQGALQSPDNSSTNTNTSTTATNSEPRTGKVGLSATMRFSKLDVQVDGSLTPGSDVHLSVEARGGLPVEQIHLRLTLPEISALNTKKTQVKVWDPPSRTGLMEAGRGKWTITAAPDDGPPQRTRILPSDRQRLGRKRGFTNEERRVDQEHRISLPLVVG